MDNYNIKEESNNEVNGESKIGGFYSGFFLYGQNRGSYSMGLQKYETKIRKRIMQLKAEKKDAGDDKSRRY